MPSQADNVLLANVMRPSDAAEMYPHGAFFRRGPADRLHFQAVSSWSSSGGGHEGLDGGKRFLRVAEVRAMARRLHQDESAIGQFGVPVMTNRNRGDNALRALQDQ
jgi:hypothetical protein